MSGVGGREKGILACARRPLLYPGRVLLPMDEKAARARHAFWKHAQLFRNPMTEPATLVRTRDLQHIEDMAEDSVPVSTDADTHMSQVEKHQQLGEDAGAKLLNGFLEGIQNTAGKRIYMILDLSARTGCLARAYLNMMACFSQPVMYMGFCNDAVEHEWLQCNLRDFTKGKVLNNEISIPGITIPSQQPPPALLGSTPPKPDLNIMVWAPVKNNGVETLKLPDPAVASWKDHATYGPTLATWLASARVAAVVNLTAENNATDETSARPGPAPAPISEDEPPRKKPRVDPEASPICMHVRPREWVWGLVVV